MTVGYSVSFEFPTRSPLTHRGTVEGGNPSILASRAMRQAKRALQPRAWSSFVVVVDRNDFETPTKEAE